MVKTLRKGHRAENKMFTCAFIDNHKYVKKIGVRLVLNIDKLKYRKK